MSKELIEKINNRYKDRVFINAPTLMDGQKIEMVFEKNLSESEPLVSVVTPVYNQEDIIVTNMMSVFRHMKTERYEYIIIVDSCSDGTLERVAYTLSNFLFFPQNLVRIVVFKSEAPLFETSADNLGFYISRGDFILEIQADMEMTEEGFDLRLLKPFELQDIGDTIVGVSGRCCHSFAENEGVGRLKRAIETPIRELNVDTGVFYLFETCPRGPLMLHRGKLKELMYLDERNYYLINSDHDLFARAYHFKKWICGYVPIEFSSPLKNGSFRKPRDPENLAWIEKRKKYCGEGFLKTFLAHHHQKRAIRQVPID